MPSIRSSSHPGKASAPPRVDIHLAPKGLPVFTLLLAQGFDLKVLVNVSIREVCCRQLAIDADYLDQRIETIFLNGKPQDDVDTILVGDSATLALSAAMPGVAGAILRKKGHYAALRGNSAGSIPSAKTPGPCPGRIQVKLFNLVARDLATKFLARGILVDPQKLTVFLNRQYDTLLKAQPAISVNGTPLAWEELRIRNWKWSEILLRVLT